MLTVCWLARHSAESLLVKFDAWYNITLQRFIDNNLTFSPSFTPNFSNVLRHVCWETVPKILFGEHSPVQRQHSFAVHIPQIVYTRDITQRHYMCLNPFNSLERFHSSIPPLQSNTCDELSLELGGQPEQVKKNWLHCDIISLEFLSLTALLSPVLARW